MNALDLSGPFERTRPLRIFVMLYKVVELSLSLTCADRSNAFQVDPGYMLNLQVEMFKLILCLRLKEAAGELSARPGLKRAAPLFIFLC